MEGSFRRIIIRHLVERDTAYVNPVFHCLLPPDFIALPVAGSGIGLGDIRTVTVGDENFRVNRLAGSLIEPVSKTTQFT